MSTNNKISHLVNTQLPFFVRNDHGTFVAFMEAYYEYLEQTSATLAGGKVIERSRNLTNYFDVDKTISDFSDNLYNSFIHNFPTQVLGDKDLILKHAKEFYRSKGTEKSIRFLMRAMFGEEIEFYYPKKDVLRASDGKWYIQKTLRVIDTKINNVANTNFSAIEKFVNRSVSGNTSNASAIIERVDRIFESGTQIDELTISSIVGEFDDSEIVFAIFEEDGVSKSVTANVLGGSITSIRILDPGYNYEIGDPVIIVSSTGSGACASVGRVSTGNLGSISVTSGGAGFRAGDFILISGGGAGSGANAQVSTVLTDESIHPNTYNLVSSIISLEANTPINNTTFANWNANVIDPANAWIQNVTSHFLYTNTGPAYIVAINSTGNNYTQLPTLSIIANTRIEELGILGRMEIINGGQGYQVGDLIEFQNGPGSYGTGGLGNVISVGAANTITGVRFKEMTGHLIGGSGYSSEYLPTANVITTTGNGANIMVTALLGDGEVLSAANSTLGAIESILIINRGTGYNGVDTANLMGSGSGTAQVSLTVIEGVFTYPGRYLNDDGFISSANYLQDRDYYQNFSYVIRIRESIDNYRKVLKELLHPAGMKVFGEYLYRNDPGDVPVGDDSAVADRMIILPKTYVKTQNTINIAYTSHGLALNANVYLEFTSGNTTNIGNGEYTVSGNTTIDFFQVLNANSHNTSGSVNVGISLT